MSIRPTARSTPVSAQSAIDFKSEFVNSPAALAANHEETMGKLLSRLDQLQAKVTSQNDTDGVSPVVRSVFKTKPLTASATSDLHERVSALESVHEDALQTLGDKLGEVEAHLMDKSNAEGLMTKIASKFTLLESRISSQSQLNDRVAHLESKFSNTSDLHSRLMHLESKTPNHSILSDRMSRLESQLKPDPEHDRLITRINAKLDMIENTQRMKLNSAQTLLPTTTTRLGASADTSEMRFMQDRIDKLTTLRARYAAEERELMG